MIVEVKNEDLEIGLTRQDIDSIQEPPRKKVRLDLPEFIPLAPVNATASLPVLNRHSTVQSSIRKMAKTRNLPIYNVLSQVIETVERHQVTVITGGTGCGKSTQIPQILLKHNSTVERETPQRVSIICTQPRRIAAKTLAKRVAKELDSPLGQLVGYQVGMDAVMSQKNTQILFVTTGIFLQKLVHEREKMLSLYTHIIMDEVHERDIDSDFSLILMKHFLRHFPETKLILMSATICAQKFSNYFSKQSIAQVDDPDYIQLIQEKYRVSSVKQEDDFWIPLKQEDNDGEFELIQEWGSAWNEMVRTQKLTEEQKQLEAIMRSKREEGQHFLLEDDEPAPVIAVPQSQKFIIDTYYLNTLHEFFNQIDTAKEREYEPIRYQESLYYQENPRIQDDSIRALMSILDFIESPKIKNSLRLQDQSPNGAVLVFLPGYQEIMDCREAIFGKFGDSKFETILLHSSITVGKEFEMLNKHKRRLILSTNVAESSITVPDCLFVVDFCLTKEIIYNPRNLCEKLALQYCSKASCDQRKGRTGRLFPGFCFRLIPESLYKDRLIQYAICEMLRCPLEKIILRLKKIHQIEEDIDIKEKSETADSLVRVRNIFREPKRTLSTAIDPPSLAQIDNAIKNLQRLGALTYQGIQITQLGLLMCELPIDIFLTRFILFANIIGCGINGINVAAILSQRKSFFLHQFSRDARTFINILYLYDQGWEDDILIQLRIFSEWEALFFGGVRLNQTQNDLKKLLRQFSNTPITLKERLFCRIKQVDPKNMREILSIKYELLMRLDKKILFLDSQDLFSEDCILRLKTAIGASFKNNILEVKKNTMNLTEKKNKFIKDHGLNHNRTILIEGQCIRFDDIHLTNQDRIREKVASVMEQYCEFNSIENCQRRIIGQNQDIHAFIQSGQVDFKQFYIRSDIDLINEIKLKNIKSKWVANVLCKNNILLVEFSPLIPPVQLQFVLKRFLHECDYYQKRNQTAPINFNWKAFVDSPQADLVQLVRETNSLVFCGSHAVVCHQYKEINCELESINRVVLKFGKEREIDKMIVAYEIQEKDMNRRNSARQTACVMHINHIGCVLWMQIIAMIFGVQVKLIYDQQKSHFIKARIDDREFQFDHFITEEDLDRINDIREQIKSRIQSPGQGQQSNIWSQLLDFDRSRQKILFQSEEKWKPLFEKEMQEEIKKITAESEESQQKRKRIPINLGPECKVIYDDFMYPIQIERSARGGEIPRQFDEEGIRIYAQVQQLYLSWKRQIIQTVKKQNFFLRMGTVTQICCAECSDYISVGRVTGLKNLEEDHDLRNALKDKPEEKEWIKRVLMVLDVSSFGDFFNITQSAQLIQQFMSDDLVQTILLKIGLPLLSNRYVFLTCTSGNHIIGFFPRTRLQKECISIQDISRIYILDRRLKLVFTSMREEPFIFRKLPIRDLIMIEKEEIQKRKSHKYEFVCKCCCKESQYEGEYFEGNERDYNQHIKSESHKRNFEELQFTIG